MSAGWREILLVTFDLPFFLFNISMIYFLSSKIRSKHKEFAGGFYVLFLVVSISDAIFYVNIIFLTRIPVNRWMLDFYTHSELWARIVYTMNGYLCSFNLFCHTMIAFNRFSALYLNQKYYYIWSGRRLKLILLFLLLLALLTVTYRIPIPARYKDVDGNIAVLYDIPFIRQFTLVERLFTFIITSLTTFILEILTAVRYRREWNKLTSNNKKFYGNKDVQLYFHCILIFISQFAATITLVIFLIAVIKADPVTTSIAQQIVVWILDFMSLASPVFLFCVSTVVRAGYLKFYGIAKIERFLGKKQPSVSVYFTPVNS